VDADAQGEGCPAEEAHVPYRPTSSGPFITFTAPLPLPGQLTAQPILNAGLVRGAFDAAGALEPRAPGEAQGAAGLSLFLEAGVLPNVSVGVQGTLLHQWRAEAAGRAQATGLGDAQVFARARVLQERGPVLPEVTVLGLAKLNTGRSASLRADLLGTDVRGSGSVDLTAGVDLTRGVRPVLLHVDLLYTHALPAVVGGERVQYGGAFSWSGSVEWPFLEERLGLMLEVSGRHQAAPVRGGVREADGGVAEVVVGAGLEVLFSPRAQLLVGYQRSLWGLNSAALDTVVLTVVPTLF
jgi:hypothetical protein